MFRSSYCVILIPKPETGTPEPREQVPVFPEKVAAQHNPLCDASNQITVPISLPLCVSVCESVSVRV